MKKLSIAALAAMTAAPAMAHTGHGDASGLLHGLQHPVFGMDHLLAMLTVGLWSGFVLPTRFWAGAVAFLAAMAAGAGLSWAGLGIPMVETWITLSVAVFGVLTLVGRRDQAAGLTQASLLAIALFALCHGHAHASEATGEAVPYLAGFLIATATLHLAGIGIARAVARRAIVQRALGLGVTASGLLMLAG
ncbi:HupE/UreJ family protein [Rhodobacter sp. Har01]|uniref:HupE/UreJ family protein n=1 Tax=Rhodobacter sp. Har01 TaxID=2883999 RepID=UPI001D07BE95|nr:HupE/UreJ family protein [Rhodobacter sp. Har01]MCB6176701.1 HupE/UreJ family protein [Rhodobacter sp. Har01]